MRTMNPFYQKNPFPVPAICRLGIRQQYLVKTQKGAILRCEILLGNLGKLAG